MSNKSSNSKPALQSFSDIVKQAAEKRQQLKEAQEQKTELPKPKTQTISDEKFMWTWEPIQGVYVQATFYRDSGSNDGLNINWYIQLHCDEKATQLFNEDAKLMGEALLAAHEWQHIWKQHVADYMLGELGGEPPKVPEPVHITVVEDDHDKRESYPPGYPELGG